LFRNGTDFAILGTRLILGRFFGPGQASSLSSARQASLAAVEE
jgi:hypothetical protein